MPRIPFRKKCFFLRLKEFHSIRDEEIYPGRYPIETKCPPKKRRQCQTIRSKISLYVPHPRPLSLAAPVQQDLLYLQG